MGVPPPAFWRANPRRLAWHHAVARRQDREEAEAAMTLVWAREVLARAKRMPKLAEWLGKTTGPSPTAKPAVVGTARDFMRHLSAGYRGGEVKKIEPANNG